MDIDGQPEPKKEKDFSDVVDVQLPESEKLAKSGKLQAALDQLLILEKQTRTGADLASNTRVLIHILTLIHSAKDWKLLNEYIVLLSKKHGLLKQAITKMVQHAMTHLDTAPSKELKLELISTLRAVTDGKANSITIFVEVERARLTKIFAKIKEDDGLIVEAADILQELQVETFGSMERREKTDFILEQMRLCLAKKDYTRVQLISKKISTKYFESDENQDLKLRYYELLIQHALHEEAYLSVCKYYRSVYDTPKVKEDEAQWMPVLQNVILFIVLSPYDNEQSDLIHRIFEDTNLSKLPLYKEFVKCFITSELMRWPKIEEIYGEGLKSTFVFDVKTEAGVKRLKELHKRVIEHNIRVVAKYYTKITLKRLTQLLDLPMKETEEFLSNLVISKTIYARIDRPAGIVSFVARKESKEVMNEWAQNINQLLELIVKTLLEILSETKTRKFTIGFAEPELGFVSVRDDQSLIARLEYIERQKRNHKFAIRFEPNDPEINRKKMTDITEFVGTLDQDEVIDSTLNSFHVMLSYAWSDKEKVLVIKDELDRRGLTVWMDVTNMNNNIYEAMARGVLESKIIVPCISLNYVNRPNCRRELNFAADNNKPIVPVRLQKIPQTTTNIKLEAVKLITSGELYVDLSEQDWKSSSRFTALMNHLKTQIDKHLQALDNTDLKPSLPQVSELSQQDRLRNWLNPISMDDEHERLQKDYAEGTRIWLIAEVESWIELPESRVLWLNGGAGVGKSVMSYLVSAKIPQDWFGAVFYCRHNDSNKNNAVNVLKTIAFELSKKYPEYFEFLKKLQFDDETQQMCGKNSILASSVSIIHKILLIDGLKEIRTNNPVVIVIDALDECGKPGDDDRAELLSVIHEAASVLPSFVKLIVTGRPEPDIWENLYDLNAHVLETTSELNMQDLFIFTKLRISNLGLFTEEEIQQAANALTTKSEGVFVYARLACDNIEFENPEDISSLLTIINKLHTGMDSIYDSIFKARNTPMVQLVISTVCSLRKPLTIKGISKLLRISEPRVGGVHIALRSILRTGEDGSITVIHKSLKDFVTKSGRSTSVDFESVNIEMVMLECCLRVLESELRFNIANIDDEYLYTFHSEMPNFASVVASIPDHLCYSALYATSHLEMLSINLLPNEYVNRIHNMLSVVVKTKLTHWMELLSLLDRFADIISISTAIKSFYEPLHNPPVKSSNIITSNLKKLFKKKIILPNLSQILSLISDSERICGQFAIPISTCALQVYWTAVPFSPILSSFYITYSRLQPSGKFPKLLQTERVPKQWSPCISTLIGHSREVYSVAISGDGNVIVTGSGDKAVKIWNARTGKVVRTLIGHREAVVAVAISDDGSMIVSGSRDGYVKMWSVASGKLMGDLTNDFEYLKEIAVSEDGNWILTCSDSELSTWNASTRKKPLRTLRYAVRNLSDDMYFSCGFAIENDGNITVNVFSNAGVKIRSVMTAEGIQELSFEKKSLNLITIGLWDDGKIREFIFDSKQVGGAYVISNDQSIIVGGLWDKTVKIWKSKTGKEMRKFTGHRDAVRTVAISRDGKLIVSGSSDSTAKIWNAAAENVIRTFKGDLYELNAIALREDGNLAALGSSDTTVKLWNADIGKETRSLIGHRGGVIAVAINIYKNLIVSGSWDTTVKIWNGDTGDEIRTLIGHTDRVNAVAISHDGNVIVSGSEDETVKVWNANTGDEIHTLVGHGSAVTAVAISTDGTAIGSRDYDGMLFLWSASRGELLPDDAISSFHWSSEYYSLQRSGWIRDLRSGMNLFWIPSEFRAPLFCSSLKRLVIFTKVVEGNANGIFIDVSDFA
ncbi:26S proteasome non-ATPase regulatory subunit 12 [Nowakowskiella sp. JEL0407]|nr:26S proteasome non-ATPase regulatory subunit 12 [Nowakowskiella sp. JEL0407]